MVRHPRFELGPSAWKADILAIILMPLLNDFRILHYLLTNLKNIKYYPSISKNSQTEIV